MPTELGAAGVVLLRALPDPAALIERTDGRLLIRHGNAAIARSLGRPLGGLADSDVRALFDEGTEEVVAQLLRGLDDGRVVDYEMVRERPHGRSVVIGTVTPVSSSTGVLVERDVSEVQYLARRLDELEALTETGTWSRNLVDGGMEYSTELRRIVGLGTAPGHIDSAFQVVHPDDRDRLRRALDEVRDTGSTDEIEYRVVRPTGEQRIVCTRASRAVDRDGRPVRLFGTMQDITRRRALEAGEESRQRMVRQQDRAMQLNDDVIQALARAWLALDLGRPEEARLAVTEGMDTLRSIMSELLQGAGGLYGTRRVLRPGDLAHLRAVRAERYDAHQSEVGPGTDGDPP